jgi:Ca2+-binding RTX toxin-like protein
VLIDNDGDTAGSTLTINVTNADRAPIVRDDHVITNLNGSGVSIAIPDYALLFNDKDGDGQTIAITGVSGADSGTVSHSTGVVTFTDGAFSSDGGSFVYTGTAGGKNDTGMVTVDREQAGESTLDGTGLADILIARNSATTLMGYEGDDVLIGGSGKDTLIGGAGVDLLVGGSGADHFQFNALSELGDHIKDFSGSGSGGDKDVIDLLNSAFGGVSWNSNNTLNETIYTGNDAATHTLAASQHFAYDSSTGTLYYDANGGGADASRMVLAILDNHAAIAATDIHKV